MCHNLSNYAYQTNRSHSVKRQDGCWMRKRIWKRCARKRSWPAFRYYPISCEEGLSKTTETKQPASRPRIISRLPGYKVRFSVLGDIKNMVILAVIHSTPVPIHKNATFIPNTMLIKALNPYALCAGLRFQSLRNIRCLIICECKKCEVESCYMGIVSNK